MTLIFYYKLDPHKNWGYWRSQINQSGAGWSNVFLVNQNYTTLTEKQIFFKVRSLLDYSCAILISFKIEVIFNIHQLTLLLCPDLIMSDDVLLKMTTILKEMMIAQLCSKSEQTLVFVFICFSISLILHKYLERFELISQFFLHNFILIACPSGPTIHF